MVKPESHCVFNMLSSLHSKERKEMWIMRQIKISSPAFSIIKQHTLDTPFCAWISIK